MFNYPFFSIKRTNKLSRWMNAEHSDQLTHFSTSEPCTGGHYLNDQSGCQTCEAGYYSAGGTVSECTKCDADKYSEAGATQCTDCPSGKGVASGEGKQESDCQGCNM